MLYRGEGDETLVMLTLAGETRAYETLVVRYQSAVLAAANSVIHNGNLAEDAAQDAFITAWMKLDTLRERDKFGAWVCRIAKNCAKNMIVRFRSYLPLDELENTQNVCDISSDPGMAYASSEAEDLLHESIDGLPKRVREVIELHYFHGLSIAEIADRMRISVGAVKYHLHEGRRRIRKDLCAMNEKIGDTLPVRIMKKIEELKLWQLRQNKDGFEDVYADVLREVEELPESKDKYHALADVLVRGWWWLPGKKNDELFARIVEAAELGHNDEVMKFIVSREDDKLSGADLIEFIRDKQIPRLEAAGFREALALEWFWLAYEYFHAEGGDQDRNRELGFEALSKAREVSDACGLYGAYAAAAEESWRRYFTEYKDKVESTFALRAGPVEIRHIDGRLCCWSSDDWFNTGELYAFDRQADFIFANASLCDGMFTVPGASVGESVTGSDGTTLTFAADDVTVEVPCGTFTGCQLWVVRRNLDTYRTYYKYGVGIVKQERSSTGITETRELKSYEIVGGCGIIPLAVGNTWEYAAGYDPSTVLHDVCYRVYASEEERATLTMQLSIERLRYDENSWRDMVEKIRNDYCRDENGHHKIRDVSHEIERAEALAKTPREVAHTRAAASVARRIMATDPDFNPDWTENGLWNFFMPTVAEKRGGKITIDWDPRWSFEWKGWVDDRLWETVLYNDVYHILQDNVNCIWSDSWQIGASREYEYVRWDETRRAEIQCLDGGTVSTKAGVFEGCMMLKLNTTGFGSGWEYRGGEKEYYFAPGVGVVKTVNHYAPARTAVYELTSYEGTGEGYMPVCDGLKRRFDAVGLTDGYVGWSEFEFVDDGDGRVIIFTNRCGVKRRSDITQYNAIVGERDEEALWDADKHDESRVMNGVNNFKLTAHLLERNGRYWRVPERARAQAKHRMRIMESLREDGEVPTAWLGFYANTCHRLACYMCGCGDNDGCFRTLDHAFELYEKWLAIPDGEAMDVGDEHVFSGVKVIKGDGVLELPDGTREPLPDDYIIRAAAGDIYAALTAPHGWEWYDGARGDERYAGYVERAKKLMETGKA